MTVRILIADDHAVVRRGVAVMLESELGFVVAAEVADGADAIEQLCTGDFDLAVLDVSMPTCSGLEVVREVVGRRVRTPAIILSMYSGRAFVQSALRAGARGFVCKTSLEQDLLVACRRVLGGELFVCDEELAPSPALRDAHAGADLALSLTQREKEVLRLLADGFSGMEIAEALYISPKTVERHRSNILAKVGAKDRVELVRLAIRQGLIQP